MKIQVASGKSFCPQENLFKSGFGYVNARLFFINRVNFCFPGRIQESFTGRSTSIFRAVFQFLILLCLIISSPLLGGEACDNGTIVIRFGDSSVERYAASELAGYLSRIFNDKDFVLLDGSFQLFRRDNLTLPYPKAIAEAQIKIAQKAQGIKADNNEKIRGKNSLTQEDFSLPCFILGTVKSSPLQSKKFQFHLNNIRKDSDGFYIGASDNGRELYIISHTSRGVLYGVYHYLQSICGFGFFEDGQYIPDNVAASVLPPYNEKFDSITEEPEYDYRAQWVWSRYYGPVKGHPANWGYDQWVSHLRWLTQSRFNSVLIYAVGYTRIWGDVFKRAFPEVERYYEEIRDDIESFWGAHYSAKANWGRSPEETTRLMQRVYAFGREKLGLKFEFNFYLGDFEDTLREAYPEGKWIDWSNVPHHAYFGAAGRQATLAFTDPKCKQYSQKLWKTFIDTFGTDHRYWISYREESAPDPDNPFDPDRGKSLADAVNAQRKWMLEVDPDGEFFHWDWHGLPVWAGKEIIEKYPIEKFAEIPLQQREKAAQRYVQQLSPDITIVSVIPQGLYERDLVDLTKNYKPHPWVIGSLLGYAMQDVGIGGLQIPVDKFFNKWQKWARQDIDYGSRLRGVLHWNEIVQVSPLIDYCVAKFGWTGKVPQNFYDPLKRDKILDSYFKNRLGSAYSDRLRKAYAFIYSHFPQIIPSMQIPTIHKAAGLSDEEEVLRAKLILIIDNIVSLKDKKISEQETYKSEVIHVCRIALHTISRLDLQEAIGLAKSSSGKQEDIEKFQKASGNAIRALEALANVLATDRRFSVSDAIYTMLNEPGVNRLMRLMMLEHSCGLLFDNYALTDSAELLKDVSVPLLKYYLKGFEMTVKEPCIYPFEKQIQRNYSEDGAFIIKNDRNKQIQSKKISGIEGKELELKNDFMEMIPLPFGQTANKAHPAEVLEEWLSERRKR